jgi:hypothetical protein
MKWCDKTLMVSPVEYGLCLDSKEYIKLCAAFANDKKWAFLGNRDEARTHTLKDKDGYKHVIVCMAAKPKKDIDAVYSVISHEAVHVWQIIRTEIGEHKPGIEQEAYCIEQIATNLFESYRKQTGGK